MENGPGSALADVEPVRLRVGLTPHYSTDSIPLEKLEAISHSGLTAANQPQARCRVLPEHRGLLPRFVIQDNRCGRHAHCQRVLLVFSNRYERSCALQA